MGLSVSNSQGVEEVDPGDQVPDMSLFTGDLLLVLEPQANQMQWKEWRNRIPREVENQKIMP